MEELFVYGTLCYPDVQQRVIGRTIHGREATLTGYAKDESGLYPYIYEDENSSVDGLVLELTDYELDRTDEYEGKQYDRSRVTLDNGDEVWAYIGDNEKSQPDYYPPTESEAPADDTAEGADDADDTAEDDDDADNANNE